MKKATKGALAAAAAGSLLLGGAGSLAYWTGTDTVTGKDINGGTLALGAPSCDWTVSHLGGTADPFDPTADLLVPGDTATEICTSTVTAKGANLTADLTVSGGDASGTLSPAVTVTPTFDVGGSPTTSITSADDGATLTATIVVAFPFGTEDNTSNDGKTVSVADYVITATQS